MRFTESVSATESQPTRAERIAAKTDVYAIWLADGLVTSPIQPDAPGWIAGTYGIAGERGWMPCP